MTCDELVWTLESSIPSDLRATDQDVAVFVRSLAGNLGAQRWRALELAAAETDAFASWAPVSESDPPPRDGISDEGARTSGGEPPDRPRQRSSGGLVSLLMSAGVFAFSVFTLFAKSAPLASTETPAPTLRHAARACPPASASAVGPQSRPGRSVVSTSERLSKRSENP